MCHECQSHEHYTVIGCEECHNTTVDIRKKAANELDSVITTLEENVQLWDRVREQIPTLHEILRLLDVEQQLIGPASD